MDKGRLLQLGPPAEVYEQPASCWVANFVGEANLVEGTVSAVDGRYVRVTANGGEKLRATTSGDVWPGTRTFVAIRPEKDRDIDAETAVGQRELSLGPHRRGKLSW